MNTVSLHPASSQPLFTKEGYQEPLLSPEAYEVDSQALLFCGGSSAEVEEPAAEAGKIDALLAGLQLELSEEADLPACKRSAEAMALPVWRERSSRREGLEYAHPAEHADVRGKTDAELGERWGWLSKHRGRGLSARDEAVQREVYARCLGMADLYGLDLDPRGSAFMREALREMGCRSDIARHIAVLFELMVTNERMALRLSAADARTLYGWSRSAWWAAVAWLESRGVLRRVRGLKKSEHGFSPVQTDTNLYALGPWWFEAKGKDPTPLQKAQGLFAKLETGQPNRGSMAGHHDMLNEQKARRREMNQESRDRNRKRHHDLPAKATTSSSVVLEAEILARRRQSREQEAAQVRATARAQAMLRGEDIGLGEPRPMAAPEPPEVTAKAEAAAQEDVSERNRGQRPRNERLRLETRALLEASRCRYIELPSGHRTAIPKGKNEGNLNLTREAKPSRKPPPPSPEQRPPQRAEPIPRAEAGDNESTKQFLCVRAWALDGRACSQASQSAPKSQGPRGPDFFREAFTSLYGRQMPD